MNGELKTVFPRFDLGHIVRKIYFGNALPTKVYATIDCNGEQTARVVACPVIVNEVPEPK